MLTRFSVWLMPDQPYWQELQAKINRLAKIHHAPVFEPHLTLFCGETEGLDGAKQRLADILAAQQKLVMVAAGINFSEKYYQTLYIEFRSNPHATKLNQIINAQLDLGSDYEFNPHLSFLYKHMLDQEKRILAESLNTDFANKKIIFNTVKLMSCDLGESSQTVESWACFERYKLQG